MGKRVGVSVDERFWEKVSKTDTCWLWTGSCDGNGYARLYLSAMYPVGLAHRYSYEMHKGGIPEGLHIDHLCRVRHCVNPAHLEAVTKFENTRRGMGVPAINARKTHCKNGHEFTKANTYCAPGGNRRDCRRCRAGYQMRLRAAIRYNKYITKDN